jgi:hypothetical protein
LISPFFACCVFCEKNSSKEIVQLTKFLPANTTDRYLGRYRLALVFSLFFYAGGDIWKTNKMHLRRTVALHARLTSAARHCHTAATFSHNHVNPATCSTLEKCLNVVRLGKVRGGLNADDVFRICGIVSVSGASADPLGLSLDTPFLLGLAHYYKKLDAAALQPFQKSLIVKALGLGVIEHGGSSLSSSVVTTDGNKAVQGVDPEIDERITAIWAIVNESREANHIGATDLQKITRHCEAMALTLRSMNGTQAARLVKALAVMNYQNYNFTSVLARRCCEVATQWSGTTACQVLFNLLKLNIQDSLVAILNRIDASVETLTHPATFLFFQSMERQANTSAAAAKIVPKVATRAAALFSTAEAISYHRSFLVCLSRYGLGKHPSVVLCLNDCARFINSKQSRKIDLRDLMPILFTLVDLRVTPTTEGVPPLIEALNDRLTTIDHANLFSVVEFLSVYPCSGSEGMMSKVLCRLENDCGRLTVPHFVGVLEMIASYPPAKGHPCLARFAFAAQTLKETLDADALERIIGCLLESEQLSDDFFLLCEFAHAHRQGVARNTTSLMHLFQVTSPRAAADARWKRILVRAVEGLAAILREDELSSIRAEVTRLGIQDPNLQQKIFGRMRNLQKEAGARKQRQYRRGYDPVDDL